MLTFGDNKVFLNRMALKRNKPELIYSLEYTYDDIFKMLLNSPRIDIPDSIKTKEDLFNWLNTK